MRNFNLENERENLIMYMCENISPEAKQLIELANQNKEANFQSTIITKSGVYQDAK